ncbi:DNA mismatch repair endonuclease MutL [Candidatus Sumerlaeota bacterium]|nr:DNA mismatch repair endonuclease MutL [Candidatus Sumerlaeota bacterium]
MIRRLPQELINQIAAGEVVVRPASVVKELAENSIDAGATRIHIAIGNENRDISVTDDGCGIPPGEATLALERHATSKIERSADLRAIMTRGFRGEALASIASVSKMELVSRPAGQLAGTRIVVWGGQLQQQEPTGCPEGTRIEIRELFYNVPARRKFLKTPASEWGHIANIATQQALGSPSIGFKLEREGRIIFDLPPQQSLDQRFIQLCGSNLEGELLPVEHDKQGVKITGFTGKPAVARKDRRHQYFFVNGRPVANRAMQFSLQQAYHGLLMTGRYPIALLFLEINPQAVDVNVHPTKEEIRFQDERIAAGLLNRAVVAALETADLKPSFNLGRLGEPSQQQQPPPNEPSRPDYAALFNQAARELHFDGELRARQSPGQGDFIGASASAGPSPFTPSTSSTPSTTPPAPQNEIPFQSIHAAQPQPSRVPEDFAGLPEMPRPIAQLGQTYIIAQTGDELILIDQHAAHERLLFEKIRNAPRHGSPSQQLLIPVTLEIPPASVPALEELAPLLHELGFEIEPFGGQTYNIEAVPADLAHADVERLLRDLLDDFDREGRPAEIEHRREQLYATMACHAAIRAGQTLQPEEMRRLIYDLYTTPTTHTCPHGRPTIIRLTKTDLDKQFGRLG